MHFLKLKKYVDQLDFLLKQGCAGTASELAQKLGVSERTLRNHLQQLREMGIEIVYDPRLKTYKYPLKGSIIFMFNLEDMNQIKGGTGLVPSFSLEHCTLTKTHLPESMLHNI